jgi:pantoate--beta-alanine ligase
LNKDENPIHAPYFKANSVNELMNTKRKENKSKASTKNTPSPQIITSKPLMQAVVLGTRAQGQTIGLVPTMGALHDGHLALIREARLQADLVIVSIFVNPLQFNSMADLKSYPANRDRDVALCAEQGVDVIFAPDAMTMYPPGFDTTVSAGALAKRLEGKSRPGHFDGVLTAVAKLFSLTFPHFAIFGEKDFQQLALVRRMTRDLHFPVEIVPMPVIRDLDGLALSSRNALLAKKQRQQAVCLFNAIQAVQEKVSQGEKRRRSLLATARKILTAASLFEIDYVDIVAPKTLKPIQEVDSLARILIAGQFQGRKTVRLLDNGPLFPNC